MNISPYSKTTASNLPSYKVAIQNIRRLPQYLLDDQIQFSGDKFKKSKDSEVYKFGTAGYREIGEKFNNAVPKIVGSISDYLITNFNNSRKVLPLLLGGDTRGISADNIYPIISMLTTKNFDVYFCQDAVPTPALAYAAKYFKNLGLPDKESAGAILLTASHNPWKYGGINFLTPDGEVAPNSVSNEFVNFQVKPLNLRLDGKREVKVKPIDDQVYSIYKKHIERLIDFKKIQESGISVFYDGLYGAGRYYMPSILNKKLPNFTQLNNEYEPPSIEKLEAKGINGPEPNSQNLKDLAEQVKKAEPESGLKLGLANDGDADRFGVMDENGRLLNPNEVLALTLYHLAKNKNRKGMVVRSQATSHIMDELANKFDMKTEQTPVGYKYIAEVFKESKIPVVIGGESSGGLSIYGHIPEKDGIIANLSILELMAYEKKPIGQILASIKKSLPNHYQFTELQINTEKKDELGKHFQDLLKNGGQFAGFDIDVKKSVEAAKSLNKKFHMEDGTKIYLNDGSWLLYRKGGTEPVGRIYFEGIGKTEAQSIEKHQILRQAIDKLLSSAPYNIDSKQVKERA